MASVFTRIIDGELPGHFLWQDERCVAILTIAPICPGHLLLIPREPVDHWDDLPPDLAGHLMQVGSVLAKALKRAYSAPRVGMIIAGFEVPHVHLHLFPADSLDVFDFERAAPCPQATLADNAERIRQALQAA